MQLSHRTPSFWRLSSSVTVSSVVSATAAEPTEPGSHATIPPTATTANTAAGTGRRHRVPRRALGHGLALDQDLGQLLVSAPLDAMDGSLPPSQA
ncbi:hypothetical protein GCM10027162_61240 [Streptomyces incanus]